MLRRWLLLVLALASAAPLGAGASERDDFIAAYRADSGGSFADASKLYHKVLRTNPNCDECHWNMALGTDKLGRGSEAEHHYEQVVRILADEDMRPALLQKTLKDSHLATSLVQLGRMAGDKEAYDEAAALFRRALVVEPASQPVREALRQLEASRSAAAHGGAVEAPKFPDAERVTLEQLQADPDLVSGRRAFVLVGATDDWKGRSAWGDLTYFSETDTYMDTTVDFYPFNLAHARRKPWLKPWKELVHGGGLASPEQLSILEPSPETNKAYDRKPYAQWRVPRKVWTTLGEDLLPDGWSAGEPVDDIHFLRTDPRVPDVNGPSSSDSWLYNCIGGGDDPAAVREEQLDNWWGQTRWRMLLVGEENSTMFLHQDDIATATWQWQALGRKRWLICPPEASTYLYAESHMSPIDGFNPDVNSYPLFAKANCSDVIANPGDVLYYPSHWFHQTLNLDPITVGVAGRHINVHNYREVHTYFKKHCSTPQRRVPNAPPLEPPTCSRLDSCLVEWRKIWGGKEPKAGSSKSAAPKAAATPPPAKGGSGKLSVDEIVSRLKAQRKAAGAAAPTPAAASESTLSYFESVGLGAFAAGFEAAGHKTADAVAALGSMELGELGNGLGMETGEILKLSRKLRKRARSAEL